MRLDLIPRDDAGSMRTALAAILALVVAFMLGGLLVMAFGRSPGRAFEIFITEPLSQSWSLQEILVKAVPLTLIALGLAFCFRANRWNIGADGQFTIGGLVGGALALRLGPVVEGPALLVIMLAVGTLGGMLYALIPAWLRNRYGVNEILSSLMLVYVAQFLLDYMVRGPLRDPKGFNMPQSAPLGPSAVLPSLFEGGRLTISILVCLVVILAAHFIFNRTLFGFALKAAGDAPRAAAFAGFNEKRLTLAAFAISGGLAGLAGILEVSGQIGQLKPQISVGYGFSAIIVAFLGRLQPFGMALSGILLSLITIGAENAQIVLKLPLDLAQVFQGLLLFCVLAAETLANYSLRISLSSEHKGQT